MYVDIEQAFHKVCVAIETYAWDTSACGPGPNTFVPAAREENVIVGRKSKRRYRSCRTAEGGVFGIRLERRVSGRI